MSFQSFYLLKINKIRRIGNTYIENEIYIFIVKHLSVKKTLMCLLYWYLYRFLVYIVVVVKVKRGDLSEIKR